MINPVLNIEKHILHLIDNCNALISFNDHCGLGDHIDSSQVLSWMIYQINDILLAYRMLEELPVTNTNEEDLPF